MTPKKTYLPVISSLRGWAATAICFYHFIWSTANYIEDEFIRAIFYYAQYGVPMFFVISGVVLPLSMLNNNYQFKHLSTFISKRLIRLEPPYLVSLIFGALYLIFQSYRHTNAMVFSWTNFLLHLGYLIPFVEGQQWINPIYWSLAVEFQYYLFLSIGWLALNHSKSYWRYSIYTIMLTACFISQDKALVFRWLPLFLIGIVYVLHQSKKIDTKEYLLVSLLGLFSILYWLGICNMLVSLVTLSIIHYCPNHNPFYSDWIGKRSYSLYLLHLIVGQALVNFLSHSYRLPYQKVLVILLGYGISLFAAWLLHKYIEKPSQIAAKQLIYPN